MIDATSAAHRESAADVSLAVFRDPASVVVVGASDDRRKWGHWLAAGAQQGRDVRAVHFVNRSAATVLDQPAFPSVREVPGAPDLVVLGVPPHAVAAVVDDALACGARGFLAVTAGVPDEPALAARIRAAGARIIGPNSLGLYDHSSRLQLAWGRFRPGSLAVVSQSGQLGSEIARLAARSGLGISRFVSIGNQIDVRAAELLADLESHDATHTIALYLESFTDGAVLIDTLRRLTRAGKRTIILTTGTSDASRRLARSHTGSLTSSAASVDAAARAAGAIRVSTPAEVVHLARYLDAAVPPAGRRIAVLTDSGGQGGIAADVAAAEGLAVPALSPKVQAQLERLLPPGAAVANPVDLAGAGEADLFVYAAAGELLAASGEVDAVVVSGYLGCYGEDTPELEALEVSIVDRLGAAVRASETPLIIHSMTDASRAVARAAEHGMPVYTAIETAMRTIAQAADLGDRPGREPVAVPMGIPPREPGYVAARAYLARLGVPLPPAVPVRGPEDLARAVSDLGTPVVLKAGWLEHKSERGGVVLGLTSEEELACAYHDMRSRLGDGEYVVETQDTRSDTVELIVGARRDPDFGAMVVVGAGGVHTELHRDVRVEIAPVDHATARDMLRGLRVHPLLMGWRGRPPVDIDALAEVIVHVSEAIASQPRITELELNPVIAGPDGALAVDALIVTSPTTGDR